ncbi:hypothetical protein KVR01_012136 [Diaporthe batatas]|uniref:uncharacterized protein n=1 Tax=Diaporthe batatas TaxID=748121 RepID=UPI001D04DC19|nr:uncharacterized protein KVR01_012136 [Diaporthe batatas]KAG8157864.1 hypothetical protein KVR01_012136 [Diaporthe batatas]
MPFLVLFLVLAMALFSGASQVAKETGLGALQAVDPDETEWAAATFSLQASHIIADPPAGSSLSDIWDLPPGLILCNKTTDTKILHSDVDNLVTSLYAGKSSAALLRAGTGELWKIVHKAGDVWRGTQIYICNFGEFDVPFSVAEYDIVNDLLNDRCRDLGGWVFFIKWAIWVGRDATNDDGTFRWVCGNSPPPGGSPGPIRLMDLMGKDVTS